MNLKIINLTVKRDERGWLAEIFDKENIGQDRLGLVLITTALPSKTKGNHYHKRKKEWYCVIKGKGLLKIWSRDGIDKKELGLSEENITIVEIPINYFHSITNIGEDELYLLSFVDEPFDPKDPDTYFE